MFFFQFFFPYSWNRQWNDRPLGSCDMNSPLEKLVREVIKMPLGLKFALYEYEHCPFFHCGSASRASMKQNISSVVGFIVVALYNTSATCHYCGSKEDFKVVQHTVANKSFLEDNLLSCRSRPQSPRSFWSAPSIETSGRGQVTRKRNSCPFVTDSNRYCFKFLRLRTKAGSP